MVFPTCIDRIHADPRAEKDCDRPISSSLRASFCIQLRRITLTRVWSVERQLIDRVWSTMTY